MNESEQHERNLARLARDILGLSNEQREQLNAAAAHIRRQQFESEILAFVAADDSADPSDWSPRIDAIRAERVDAPHATFRQLAERAMQKHRETEDKTQDMPLNPRPRTRV